MERFVRWCGEWFETLRIAPPFSQRRRDILAAIADSGDPSARENADADGGGS